MSKDIKVFWIDLFCGAGGTTSGIHLAAEVEGIETKVVACVNHDENAILSHKRNHPDCLHLTEDIRDFNVVKRLKKLVKSLREEHPDCIINLWASLECTNFSKAKGGMPRDADSRTLAEHMFMYVEELDPDYVWFENVVEFMCWGPLDEKGKPLSRKRGKDYLKWVDNMKDFGYRFDWKELNAADFGAYTSRVRWFGQFAKKGFPLSWPERTHAKNPGKANLLFDKPLEKWKPVKEVLNLEHEGKSIFNRKKPLVENTLKRIYAGLVKFVADGDDSFIKKYFSGRPAGKVISINGPAGTVTTFGSQAVVKCDFLQSYYGNGNAHSTDEPCPTVSTRDRFGKISTQFIEQQYGNSKPKSLDEPLNTITINPKFGYVTADHWLMDTSFQNKGRSIEKPAPTILASRKHHYIMNPQYKNPGNSVNKPAPTVIARQDKKPLGLIQCDHGEGFIIPVYEDDNPTMVKIKQFMAYFGIIDIKMRMLEVEELLKIQGFPEGYKLVGTQTDKKKYIGNSVEVNTSKSLVMANYSAIVEHFKVAA